jgi:hypothetical protein
MSQHDTPAQVFTMSVVIIITHTMLLRAGVSGYPSRVFLRARQHRIAAHTSLHSSFLVKPTKHATSANGDSGLAHSGCHIALSDARMAYIARMKQAVLNIQFALGM